MSEVGTILEQWRESGVKWVRFELPDMHGNSRSKTIPIQHAGSYAETGLNMYGGAAVLDTRSDVVGGTLYNEERGYGDQLLFPDPDTAALVPWADDTARLICDPSWQDGSVPTASPRHVYRRALERARSMGFEPLTGSEFEFYLLDGETRAPLFEGYHIFNTVRNDWVPTIRRILEEMPQIGVDIITSNSEYAGSQWEINFSPGRGPARARTASLFKNGEGDRQAGRIPGDVHVEAVRRRRGERLPQAPLPAAVRGWLERVQRRRRPGRVLRGRPPLHRRAAAPREVDRRADRADGELPASQAPPHVQPDEHLVGNRRTARR